jgi:hypothetical protein
MTQFQADAATLFEHAALHQQIAQFYRDAATQLQSHGQKVVNELEEWSGNQGQGADYQNQWLLPSTSDLSTLADEHDQWAAFFNDLGQKVLTAENQLNPGSQGNSSGGSSGPRFE